MSDVAKAAAKAREWVARRNEAIREALERGESSRSIAAEAGLSHVAVQKIGRR